MEDLRAPQADSIWPSYFESGSPKSLFGHPVWTVLAIFVAGCDPVIGIAGATFPVWMLCVFAGILASLAVRPLFVVTGIDEWLAPRPIVYACLALTIAFLSWLTLWWRA